MAVLKPQKSPECFDMYDAKNNVMLSLNLFHNYNFNQENSQEQSKIEASR